MSNTLPKMPKRTGVKPIKAPVRAEAPKPLADSEVKSLAFAVRYPGQHRPQTARVVIEFTNDETVDYQPQVMDVVVCLQNAVGQLVMGLIQGVEQLEAQNTDLLQQVHALAAKLNLQAGEQVHG